MDFIQPVGLGGTGAGINPVWRGGKREDPEGSIFLLGVARSVCVAAEPPEAAF
jgi:hypothetical protein